MASGLNQTVSFFAQPLTWKSKRLVLFSNFRNFYELSESSIATLKENGVNITMVGMDVSSRGIAALERCFKYAHIVFLNESGIDLRYYY